MTGLSGILHVPYRGAGPAIVDNMAGTVPMTTPNINGQILDLHRTGKLRILAVFAPQRLKVAPDIPAANETVPDMVMQLVAGVCGPADLPAPVVDKLATATGKIMQDLSFLTMLEKSGMEARPDPSSTAARVFLTEERARLLPIMKSAGLKPQ